MIGFALASLISAAHPPAPPPPPRPDASVEIAQLTITQQIRSIIIRVPSRRSQRYKGDGQPPGPPMFKEHKGPKCIDAAAIGGAAVTSPDSVDFMLRGGQRVRAKLENACPALDYYSGFYVQAPADGQICADRDSIHTRSGGDCQVDKFRILTPVDASK